MNTFNKLSLYGASGFIGTHFKNMYDDGCCVIPREEDVPHTDNILYLVSTTHNYHIFDDTHLDVNTNLNKLISVLDCCRKKYDNKFTFNFISSWFVYGMNCSLDTKETDHCDPRGFYSITKRAAEQMLICYCNTFGINYRIMRMTNIIGKGDAKASAKKNALQHMIDLLKQNEEIRLYNGGSNIRDYMDVHDACRAIDVCVRNSPLNETINISNHEPVTIGEVIHYCKNKLNSESKLVSIEPPYFHKVVQVKDVCLNNDKLRGYGYAPSINTFHAVDRLLN
jgi:nucleoside-diphosphate-sugar epimerase